MKNLTKVTTVVIEGGGMAGIGEAGAWSTVSKELEHQGAKVSTFGGTSAGAIIALLCALRLPLRPTMESTPWKRFMPNQPGRIRDIWEAITTGAFSDLTFAAGWLRERVVDGGLPPDATFADLKRLTGVSLEVVATNEETMRPELFSVRTTPGVEVALAVLASMAIPGVWPSVTIKGIPYCDGGVWANLPLRSVAGHLDAEQVVGFSIQAPGSGRLAPYKRSGIVRAHRLLQAIRNGQQIHQPSHLYPSRVVIVPRPFWAHATAFDLSRTQMVNLWSLGVVAANRWLRGVEKT